LTSRATGSQAFDRRNVTSSLGSFPASWNHSACSSPKDAPQTALAAVKRSWIGVVSSGLAAGSSSFGNEIWKRRR
jgi:hypothetical protein